jgi:hypothetical protein
VHILDLKQVAESDTQYRESRELGTLQTVVFVMCGGGMTGRFAAEQPADFYIDDRCGRLPYRRKDIIQAVRVLAAIAEARGLDPHKLPRRPDFHACGIF